MDQTFQITVEPVLHNILNLGLEIVSFNDDAMYWDNAVELLPEEEAVLSEEAVKLLAHAEKFFDTSKDDELASLGFSKEYFSKEDFRSFRKTLKTIEKSQRAQATDNFLFPLGVIIDSIVYQRIFEKIPMVLPGQAQTISMEILKDFKESRQSPNEESQEYEIELQIDPVTHSCKTAIRAKVS